MSAEVPMKMFGTSVGVRAEVVAAARKELEELKVGGGAVEPDRGDLDDPSVRWRFGKPDYTIANLNYIKGKTQNHGSESLEKLVENLVKTWEMEASHKPYTQWATVDQSKYSISANGGRVFSGKEAADNGNYNNLLDGCDKELYDTSKHDFESSHEVFRESFPGGFLWELLEIFSPPPKVTFSWRHWTQLNGTYKGIKGTGDVLEVRGVAVVEVDEGLKIGPIQVFYNPNEFLLQMEGKGTKRTCPIASHK